MSIGSSSEAYGVVDNELFLFSKTGEGPQIIDGIQAIAGYIAMTFDWEMMKEAVKDYTKELLYYTDREGSEERKALDRERVLKYKYGHDLVAYILRTSQKTFNGSTRTLIMTPYLTYIGHMLLNYLFTGGEERRTNFINSSSALAFLAVALNRPAKSLDQPRDGSLVEIVEEPDTKHKLIADPLIFYTVLLHMPFNFTYDAAKSAINYMAQLWKSDPRFAKELSESKQLLQLVFDLGEKYEESALFDLHCSLLLYLLDVKFPNVWSFIKPSFPHQLVLISAAIEHFLRSLAKLPEKQVPIGCLELGNLLEDAVLQDPGKANSQEFLQALARLVLVMDKAEIMYVSVPALWAFDKRLVESESIERHLRSDAREAREGGPLRILLKLTLQCISKGNSSVSANACILLRYIMFRDKELRKQVKLLAGLTSPSKGKNDRPKPGKKPTPVLSYNLLDLALKKDPTKLKFHVAKTELFAKRTCSSKGTFLDSLKLASKPPKKPLKEESVFDQGPLLLAYVLGQIFQTLHFEILGVASYSELPQGPEELRLKIESVDTELIPSARTKGLISLLCELARRYGVGADSGLVKVLTADLDETLQKLRTKMRAYCTAKDPADNSRKSQSSSPLISSIPPGSELLEDAKTTSTTGLPSSLACDLSFASQETEFEQFVSFWGMLIEAIMTAGRAQTEPRYEEIQSLLLGANNILVVHKFIGVCVAHGISRLDELLAATLPGQAPSAFRLQGKGEERMTGLYKELEGRIRDKFCYLGVHKEKIERDEMRTDFEVLGKATFARLLREQELEVNPWHSKKQERYNQALFEFVDKQYSALLKRCPLYQQLGKSGKSARSSIKEFVSLIKSRDELGRTLKFRKMRRTEEEGPALLFNFGYLRWGTLKKFLVLAVAPERSNTELRSPAFFARDFTFKLQKNLFKVASVGVDKKKASVNIEDSSRRSSETTNELTRVHSNSYSEEGSASELGGSDYNASILLQSINVRQFVPHGDYLPKSIHISRYVL